MAYIGKQPAIGNFVKLDAISVVNGQASYTMQNGGANFTEYSNVNQFLVSLNGILQSPTDSFTVSGSTITFASNLLTGDVIDFIIVLGNSLDVGVPSDNTVSLAKLTATGTKDATTFLRGDNTFAEAGGGIEEVDMFSLNDLNVNSFTTYTLTSSNTTRVSGLSGTSFTKTGTGVSIDTNGKVTFPSTGQYLLLFQTYFSILSNNNDRFVGAVIKATNNNGTTITSRVASYNSVNSVDTGTENANAVAQLIFTVTNTTNDGVYFVAESAESDSNNRLTGYDGTSKLATNFIVIKLV